MKKHFYIFSFVIFLSNSLAAQTWEEHNTSNSNLTSDDVTSIAIAENGQVWISTVRNLFAYDGVWTEYGINNRNGGTEIMNVWVTSDSSIWVGTEYSGLWNFDADQKWTHYHQNSAGNGIEGFVLDSNGGLWILDKFGWFSKWDGKEWIDVITFFSNPRSLFIDDQEHIWLISENVGITKFKDQVITEYKNTWSTGSSNYIPDASIRDMAQDSKGDYWIAGKYEGLMRFDGMDYTIYKSDNSGNPSSNITSIAIDDKDNIWIGTEDAGFAKFDGSNWDIYNTTNSPLQSDRIDDIEIAPDGKIWIAHGYNELRSPHGGKGLIVLDENGKTEGNEVPQAPGELKIQVISELEVSLSWEDNSNNEIGFLIERSVGDQSNFIQHKFINADQTKYNDKSVEASKTYYYRVRAMNSNGTSSFTEVKEAQPKYCTTNLSNYDCYANLVDIQFGEISHSVFNPLNGYYNYLDQTTTVRPGQTLILKVSFDRHRITSNNYISAAIFIDWNSDGDFEDEKERVFQNLSINGEGTFNVPVNVPANAVTGISRLRSRTHDYALTKDIEPCGSAEETQDYSIIIEPAIALATPDHVTAEPINSTSIRLQWKDNSLAENYYRIFRSEDEGDYELILDTLASNSAEYIDQDLRPGTIYRYQVQARSGLLDSDLSEQVSVRTSTVTFTKVASDKLASSFWIPGIFWGDFDSDGQSDVLLSSMLLQSQADYTLMSLLELENQEDAVLGDFNNDGHLDLFSSAYKLYQNNGDGSFKETEPILQDGAIRNCQGIDLDNDGWLDLLLTTSRNVSKVYKGKGDGTFQLSKLFDDVFGFVSLADVDSDGDLDLLCNKGLFNNLNGSFELVNEKGFDEMLSQMTGGSWGDIDNDGDMDYFGTWFNEDMPNRLFINNGKGDFTEKTDDQLNHLAESSGSSFADFDNDGNLDLVVANFHGQNLLYQGNGDGTFAKVSESIVMNEFDEHLMTRIPSHTCAWGDANADGFLDLLVTNTNGVESHYYSNSGNQNHWVRIKLNGNDSNDSGIGARVEIESEGKIQIREVTTKSGLHAQNDMMVHFGIGSATTIEKINVLWPSGIKSTISDVSPDRLITINEIEGELSLENKNFSIYPNSFKNHISITSPTDAKMDVYLVDIYGRVIKQWHLSNESNHYLDTRELNGGLFLLQIHSESGFYQKKLIKN